MRCPQCGGRTERGQCANCGLRELPSERVTGSQPSLEFAETPLKQRPLASRTSLGSIKQTKVATSDKRPRTSAKLRRVRPRVEVCHPLFHSQLENQRGISESASARRETNLNPVVFEKPLIRNRASDQKLAGTPKTDPDPTAFDEETASGKETEMSREILFSRLLAGFGDLSLSVVMALIFTGSAAWILQFDVFSPLSTRWLGFLALVFYFFNSIFFLLVSGQSPGMSFTHLVLVDAHGNEVSTRSVLLRVILFLPAVASVVGLLWGVIDPKCRCLHDHLSGTRIVRGPK